MKKISIAILAIIAIIAIIVACQKTPEVNLEYVDVERDLITVGTTTATIQCDYEYIATLKKAYLYYGEGEDAAEMASIEMRVVQKTLYVELSGLKENTTYSYYYEFANGFNSMRSATKTFKTEAGGSGGGDEPPTPSEITLPTVVTSEVTEITTNSALCGGEVTNDGGAEVTERGICWSTNVNPTLNDNHIASGTGIGAFTAMMDSLAASTTYHVRAYATNEKGTAYGLDREFTTLSSGGGSGDAPTGAINGLFTINNSGDQVYFSQGNLQYTKTTQTWSFMAHQYDIVEVDGQNVGVDYANQDIISLFGWGTSGYNHGAIAYQPWSTSINYGDYYAYGNWDYNLFDQTGMADWGYNAIVNGGNVENNGWRTLTRTEWNYVLNIRNTKTGMRYAKAKVNGVSGLILLPYNWDASNYALNDVNGGNYNSNSIGVEEWTAILETNGAVFLPAAGLRNGSGFSFVESYGNYWTSSGMTGCNGAFGLYFGSDDIGVSGYDGTSGRSVRLVRDVISHPSNTTPTVITSDVSDITSNSVVCGGEVTNDGGAEVTERGFCWSTNENPNLNDNHIVVGSGIGTFNSTINGLTANTTYHVRAYAANSVGTAYGLDEAFTTLSGGGGGNGDAPEGAINGLFSVSATTRVYFSQANLQYQASTNTWRFAENQYDCIGNANSNISSSYSGWIDLFGWGTSGYNHGANRYQPWSTSLTSSDYYAYGSYTYNLYDQTGKADWGYNPISNGGNTANTWRTLTSDEWVYVFNTRTTTSGIRYAKAKVNNVNGVILLPDEWQTSYYSLSSTNNPDASFTSNTISATQWATLEQHGAVFLAAAGGRLGTSVSYVGSYGFYWSASYIDSNDACHVYFYDSRLYPQDYYYRYYGQSVRLVRSAQ